MLPSCYTPASRLLTLLFTIMLPIATYAASSDDVAKRKILYDCQEQAAAFTKNMGRPGDQELYQQHLKDCIEIATPKTLPKSGATSQNISCKDDEYLFTFKNSTNETVWLGVWDPDNGGGVAAPSYWPNWQLDPGKENSWCARTHFNGRFMVRARCNTATGMCEEGNCCTDATQCGTMKCNTGVQPTSLVEFTFDDNKDNDKHPFGVTWYDVSYVDGYNFSLGITSNDSNCAKLGGGTLPDCPWPTINGVCLAPYLQYQIDNPWWKFEQGYYTLAAKCAYQEDKEICGCGNQCTEKQHAKKNLDKCENQYATAAHPLTGQIITLQSRGCSPFNKNNYADDPDYAQKQIVCNPLVSNPDKTKCGPWPSSPIDYTQYVSLLSASAKKSYAWQYHDEDSLTSCPSAPGKQAFTITIGGRPANKAKGNAWAPEFAPDASLSGFITVDGGSPQQFVGGNKLRRILGAGSKVTITSYCDAEKKTVLSCSATYDPKQGFTPDANADCTGPLSGINWKDPKSNNAQNLNFGRPTASVCKDPKNPTAQNFNIYAGDDFSATVMINNKNPLKFSGNTTLRLNNGDSVRAMIDCTGGGILDCTANYDSTSGLLALDKKGPNADGQPKCVAASATIGWGKEKNALRPGKPAADQCK